MTTSVLIVEDEPSILELISYTCRTSGMEVRKAANVAEAKKNLEAAKPDIILLDWMLPDCAGLDWLRELRSYHSNESLPVIMLTARGQEDDRVRGLEAGADDYVTKPFTPLELLARVNSHLRRYSKYLTAVSGEEQEKSHVYTIGGLELNEETVEVTVDGEAVKLTPMEFKIVQLLIKNPGRVFSADEIYERIWNEKAVNTDTIMVHVRNIREKIEIDPRNPKYLKVVWGVGYKIDKQ